MQFYKSSILISHPILSLQAREWIELLPDGVCTYSVGLTGHETVLLVADWYKFPHVVQTSYLKFRTFPVDM